MTAKPTRKPSVLVVDDEEALLQIFEEFLGTGEYDLGLARTGTEAIAEIRQRDWDLVVTDLNLPGADGLTVLRESKTSSPQTEVIVLTGNASMLTAVEALREGAYDYVLKPFDLYEMDQTIAKALERRRLLEENQSFVESLKDANLELERHRDHLRARVEEATLRIRTLYEVGQEISSSLHLSRTLTLILERSCELTQATAGVLFLMESGRGGLEPQVALGITEPPEADGGVVARLREAAGRAAVGRQPVMEMIFLPGGGERAALVVPLIQEEEVTGAVSVLAGAGAGFQEDDSEILVSLAAQASIAINNARVYGKIRDLERMKSEFVAVVSHEVRTPLTSIKGTLEILIDDKYFEVEPRQREMLEICRANVDRLEALINDILDFSKLESNRLSTDFEDVSLGSVAETAVVNISKLAERKRIEIITEIPPDLPVITADELRIGQVFSNLLSNAIKFSSSGTNVHLRIQAEEGGIRVEIQDEGIGISSSDLPKLFTRFGQLDSSSTRKAGGTGLGLVICRGIVEEHGGRIWAESSPGEGSTFSFWIPLGAALQSERRPHTQQEDATVRR